VSVALRGDTAVVGAALGLFTPGVDQRSAYVFVFGGEWFPVRQLGPELGAANDRFGHAVALDGDTALVGAYRGDAGATDQGAAYAFVLRDGRSLEQQHLTANDGGAKDNFGYEVALDGDTLVVGAPYDTNGVNVEQGSVYVFTRNGAVWKLQQKLTSNDGAAQDNFGYAVALNGDTLVAGAYRRNIGSNNDQGSAYIFTRSGATWTQQQQLTANDGAANDNFGYAVALSGETVAVGVPNDVVGSNAYQGSAYIFTRNGVTWTQQQKLTANDGAASDLFGFAVALSGDTVAAGVPNDAIGANGRLGSVYIFTRSGATWTQQPKLTADDGAANDLFGVSLALSGDTMVAGARGDTIGTNDEQGSAYVFTRNGATWTQRQKLTASDGAAGDFFGAAVALSGDTIVVGAVYDTIGVKGNQGSAYVYTLIGSWVPQQKLTASDGAANDYFGVAVALSGDTVVVGAYSDTIGANDEQGSAYVFVSPPCPVLTLAPASLPGGALGVAYNQQLTAGGGGVGDYQFAVSSGSLPPGLSLDPPGLLHGKPSATGTYRFTITATYSLSLCSGSRDYTVTVANGCGYTLTPTSRFFSAGGATGAVNVTAVAGCAWTAASNAPWLAITSGANGAGNGQVTYNVAANTGPARQATVNVADQTHQVQQAAGASAAPRLARLEPNSAGMSASGVILTLIGAGFTTSQRVQWNGDICETSFVSATQLRAVIPAALLTREGIAAVTVLDTANGAKSNSGKFRVVGAVAHASAASYDTIALAPNSIVAAFGANLATEVRVAESLPLPTELAGTTVTIRDRQGAVIRAPLFFVAPAQINYLMPPGLANGVATVTITNGNGGAVDSLTEINAVAPGLFSANASGGGAAAAVVLRIRVNGEQVYEPVARYDQQTQKFALLPIDLSNSAEQVYLILFGTGLRLRGALEDVTIMLGETGLPVVYAGAAPGLEGVDQVNVLLPAALRGRGEQTIVLRVNDEVSNGVNVRIQ
jgi:uncharacterized protein (TIGR03437 family)